MQRPCSKGERVAILELKVDQSHLEKTMGTEGEVGGGSTGVRGRAEMHKQSPGRHALESGLSHVSRGYR